jgi:CheY-like chemotaxis protein
VATNAGDALAAAESTTFDVVLCDLELGEDIDGYEIARRLRRSARHRNCLLVAVSGFSQDADRELGRVAGFDAHFAKPLGLTELDSLLGQRSGGRTQDR